MERFFRNVTYHFKQSDSIFRFVFTDFMQSHFTYAALIIFQLLLFKSIFVVRYINVFVLLNLLFALKFCRI